MKKLILATLATTFTALTVNAATLAIIDSGTDLEHEMLAPLAWTNPVDNTTNDRDEDKNGYQDDIHGWNFAENNNQIIDYSYVNTFSEDVYRFFEVQQDSLLGIASKADVEWARAKVKDEAFLKQLNIFGNFMHGTHVAGIASRDTNAKVLPVKIIPTEVKLPGGKKDNAGSSTVSEPTEPPKPIGNIAKAALKAALDQLAKAQMRTLEEVSSYIALHRADIANGSFGTGYPQATMIIKTLFIQILKKNPTDADVHELAVYFLSRMVENGKKMVGASPSTLFVFAAGNDALNNDVYPTSPTNIVAENVISVAATLEDNSIAKFSNFGSRTVDVAAPGVAIKSASPGNEYVRVSGTSQAAPAVARIATQVKEANSKLTPAEIKKIIVGTVDLRGYLAGKVKSGGIVNGSRAKKAAQLSKNYPIDVALSESHKLIRDMGTSKGLDLAKRNGTAEFVLPLPSMFTIE